MKHNIALSIFSAVCLVPMLFSCIGYDEDSPVRVEPSIEVWEKNGELYAGLDAVVEVFNSSLTFEIWGGSKEEWTFKTLIPDYCIGEGAGNYHEWRLSYKKDVYLKPDAKYYYRAVLLLGGDSYSSETKTILASSEYCYEYVDLGLSVKWATCNLGASSPEEYGRYYQWAGLEDVSSTSIYLDWSNCPYHKGSDETTGWTKYVPSGKSSYWSGSGSPDNKTVLDPEDDVAHVKLGGKWRMPIDAEWTELRENCTWTWTTQNGVKGYKVTSKKSGYTNKSIFLPAAGFRREYNHQVAGTGGNYWSSSLDSSYPASAFIVRSNSDGVERYRYGRCNGCSVRPVYGDDMASVTGVGLSQTSLSLNIGEIYTLSATVVPSNAAEKSVSWSSNNTSVATVDQSGKVTAVKAGSATITVKTTDGGYTATCKVTVGSSVSTNVPEAVDLGLSVKWASFNIGATKPEEYGGYYQWAGLEDVSSTSIYLDWSNCPYHTGSDSETGWTKYIPSSYSSYWLGSGSPDNKTVLDQRDDVAQVKLGGKWRMPTYAEWEELIDNCTWTQATQNGVNGFKVTGEKSGYTGKSIFIPAAGRRNSSKLFYAGSEGHYWSSLCTDHFPSYAYYMHFESHVCIGFTTCRFDGLPVRPVSE